MIFKENIKIYEYFKNGKYYIVYFSQYLSAICDNVHKTSEALNKQRRHGKNGFSSTSDSIHIYGVFGPREAPLFILGTERIKILYGFTGNKNFLIFFKKGIDKRKYM